MKIGKLGFDEIVKIALDKPKIKFATVGLFIAILISTLGGYLAQMLMMAGASLFWVNAADFLISLVSVLTIIFVTAGIAIAIKQDISKTKTAPVDVFSETKKLFWKYVGITVLFLLSLSVVGLAAWLLGFIIKIPNAGVYLMSLLSVPAAIAFGYVAVYLLASQNLLVPAVTENPTASTWKNFLSIIMLTKTKAKTILFNSVLALLVPILTVVISGLVVFGIAYVAYLYFGWEAQGFGFWFGVYLQDTFGWVAFIINTSGSLIIAYLLAHLVTMQATTSYSIYLDANSK